MYFDINSQAGFTSLMNWEVSCFTFLLSHFYSVTILYYVLKGCRDTWSAVYQEWNRTILPELVVS